MNALPSFDGFTVERALGAGAHGVVYEATEERWGRRVALKAWREAPDALLLKREFRIARGLAHPNLIELYDLHVEGAASFFTMELLDAKAWPVGGDWEALAPFVAQLLEGLAFLHGFGVVHRDLKPTNVLCTDAKRAVLLDFGVASHTGAPGGGFEGTPAYASPEQLFGAAPSEADDVYALGTMLFESLTARLPFEGDAHDIVDSKCTGRTPPALRDLCTDATPAVASWIDRALAPDPRGRPALDELMEVVKSPRSRAVAPLGFGGRDVQLAALDEVFDQAQRRTQVVWLEGEAGLGKSTLLTRFLRSAAKRGALVLDGACAPEEHVRFPALDGVVDQLALWLEQPGGLSDRPPLGHAAHLFPSLRGLAPLAERSAEPLERTRARGEEELAAALQHAAAKGPVVLAIDDTQWGDSDSIGVLRRVLQRCDDAAMMLVFATRTTRGARTPFERALGQEAERHGYEQHVVSLGPLTAKAGVTLLQRSLAPLALPRPRLEALAASCAGDPYLLSQLVAASRDATADDLHGETDSMARQLGGLSRPARALLEACAVAGDAIELDVAFDVVPAANHDVAQALLRARLLRRVGGGDVMPFHARLREAVVAAVAPEAALGLHRKIAECIMSRGGSSDRVAHHLHAAGDANAALEPARRAAANALTDLAFSKAVRFYRMALDAPSLQENPSLRAALRVAYADALRADGRPAAAAASYTDAAANLAADEALRCRRAAADCLIGMGACEDGAGVLAEALEEAGYSWPRGAVAGPAKLIVQRVRLGRAGLLSRVTTPSATTVEASAALRLDVLWTAAFGVGVTDPVPALYFQAVHTREALDLGDYRRVSRGRAVEMIYVASTGKDGATEATLRRLVAEAIEHSDDGEHRGFLLSCVGMADIYCGRFASADIALEGAVRAYGDASTMRWQLHYARVNRTIAQEYLGDYGRLAGTVPSLEEELRRSGDALNGAMLDFGSAYLVDLADGRAERATQRLDRKPITMRGKPLPPLDWMQTVARARTLLHERRPDEARAVLGSARRRLLPLFAFQHIRAVYQWLLGVAAAQARDQRALRKATARLREEQRVISEGAILLLQAHEASLAGDRSGAQQRAEKARGALEHDRWAGYAAAAGALFGGDASSVEALGVRDPERWLGLFGAA